MLAAAISHQSAVRSIRDTSVRKRPLVQRHFSAIQRGHLVNFDKTLPRRRTHSARKGDVMRPATSSMMLRGSFPSCLSVCAALLAVVFTAKARGKSILGLKSIGTADHQRTARQTLRKTDRGVCDPFVLRLFSSAGPLCNDKSPAG